MGEKFRKFAQVTSSAAGSIWAFSLALLVVLVWAITGPLFGFSDTWQLVINTGTTIVTFLVVFLIQNTQNRDSRAIHAKLDEVLVHLHGADNHMVRAEDLSDEELKLLKEHFENLADSVESQASRIQTVLNGGKTNDKGETVEEIGEEK
jgi:low affinity Fe/Cu permease